MSSFTPRLALSFLSNGAGDKVTLVNETFASLDCIASAAVEDRITTSPPASPANGDAYIIAAPAIGAWLGKEKSVAYRVLNQWRYIEPIEGLSVWCRTENAWLVYDSSESWKLREGGAICAMYSAAAITLSTTMADISWDSTIKVDSQLFISNGSSFEVREAGEYLVMCDLTFDLTAGTSIPCEAQLAVNTVAVAGSHARCTVTTAIDKVTVSINRVLTLSADTLISVQARYTTNGSQLVADGARLTIKRL